MYHNEALLARRRRRLAALRGPRPPRSSCRTSNHTVLPSPCGCVPQSFASRSTGHTPRPSPSQQTRSWPRFRWESWASACSRPWACDATGPRRPAHPRSSTGADDVTRRSTPERSGSPHRPSSRFALCLGRFAGRCERVHPDAPVTSLAQEQVEQSPRAGRCGMSAGAVRFGAGGPA